MPIPTIKTFGEEILTYQDLNTVLGTFRTTLNSPTAGACFKNDNATITAVYTFTTAPVINAALSIGGRLTVSTGGMGVTGTSQITGALTVTLGLGVVGNADFSAIVSVGGVFNANGAGANVSGTLAVGSTSNFVGQMNGTTGVFSGGFQAAAFGGNGAALTNLNAANLTGTLGALNGSALTNLNASNIGSGTMDPSFLGTALGVRTVTNLTIANGGSGFPGLSFGTDFQNANAGQSVPSLTGTGPVSGLSTVEYIKVYFAGSVTPRYIAAYS